MKIFIVLKEGVYIQGVEGIRFTLDEAIELAQLRAKNDRDSYHAYCVYSSYAGTNGARGRVDSGSKLLYSINNNGDSVRE